MKGMRTKKKGRKMLTKKKETAMILSSIESEGSALRARAVLVLCSAAQKLKNATALAAKFGAGKGPLEQS